MSKLHYIYSRLEILDRVLRALAPVDEALSCCPFTIKLTEDNSTEPTVIEIDLYENCGRNHLWNYIIDQNTDLDDFEYWMKDLHLHAELAALGSKNNTCFETELKAYNKRKEQENKDLPF